MKNTIFKLIAIFFVISSISFACNEKETVSLTDEDYLTTTDNVYSERVLYDIFNIVNKGITTTKSAQSCPAFSWNNNVLTIIYPVDGCTGTDGVKRSGTIIATFNVGFDYVWSLGDNVTITFDNYSMLDNSITGTLVMTCTSNQPMKFRISSENMQIALSETETMSWKTTLDYTMLEGLATVDDLTDDVWQIDGSASGINANGKNFTRVATALEKYPDCAIFVSGNLVVTVDTNIYNIVFESQCGTVLIDYKGIQFPMYIQ
jgi:hypothetical protein